jgi:hypothetical protein
MVAVVISSGHGRYVSGAVGILNEVDEARRVVKRVADFFEELDVDVKEFHDDTSKTQNENLKRIVGYHNAQTRDLDVSVHFNSNGSTKHFDEICASIAETISGKRLAPVQPPPEAVQPLPPEPGVLPLITITVDPPGSARVEVIGAASDEIGGADV